MSGNCRPGAIRLEDYSKGGLRFDLQEKMTKKVTKLMSVSVIRLPLWKAVAEIEHRSHKHTKQAD